MASKNKNPYKRGNYNVLFASLKTKQIVTLSELIAVGVENGMTESAAKSSAIVILSPRETSNRGDSRGNMSAQGHVYFVEVLNRKRIEVKDENGKVISSKMEPKRFRLRYRKDELPALTRKNKDFVIHDPADYFAGLEGGVEQETSEAEVESAETQETAEA